VFGATREWLASLRAGLGGAGRRLQLSVYSDLASNMDVVTPGIELDVVLAFLRARSLRSLTAVLTMHDRLGFPEIVAISEHPNDAAAAALKEFGVERVLPQESAVSWLSATLEVLASIAIAKRSLRRHGAALGQWPRVDPFSGPHILPLSVAEARFRETYLRALMAQAGSRTLAAKGAGVPYRTLCYMLERYGIHASARDPKARAIAGS
jgi:hypothetical protein